MNGIKIDFRAFVSGGHVAFYSPRAQATWRRAMVLLGGVAANAVAAVLLMALLARLDAHHQAWPGALSDRTRAQTLLMDFLLAAGLTQLLAVPVNLWPRADRRVSGKLPSDGAQLLALVLGKTPPADPSWVADLWAGVVLERRGQAREGAARCLSAWRAQPGRPEILGALAHCMGRAGEVEGAVRFYLDNKDALPEPDGPTWGHALGNVAWHALMAREPGWIGLADQLSERALSLNPDSPPVRATRGAALVARGDVEAGVRLMTDALPDIEDNRDKAEFCSFLARTEHDRGETDRAAKYMGLELHLLRRAGVLRRPAVVGPAPSTSRRGAGRSGQSEAPALPADVPK